MIGKHWNVDANDRWKQLYQENPNNVMKYPEFQIRWEPDTYGVVTHHQWKNKKDNLVKQINKGKSAVAAGSKKRRVR